MNVYVGIDPGLSGAIAAIDGDGRLISAARTPVLKPSGKGKTVYDLPEMVRAVEEISESGRWIARVALEQVSAMPHDGVTSSFRFGTGWGLWRGILAALRVPTILVRPQAWQGETLAGKPRGKDSKTSAVAVAKSLFPSIPIRYKADWGMADAVLMAEWARRTHKEGRDAD